MLYLPTYFFFGMLIYPIVQVYYEDPALSLSLAVPGFEVILPLEVGRGLLFVLTVFPLIAVLRRSRWSLVFWLGMTIAVLGAVTPMLLKSTRALVIVPGPLPCLREWEKGGRIGSVHKPNTMKG